MNSATGGSELTAFVAALVVVAATAGCRKTVSCHVERHGQCHEWRNVSVATKREIADAVCHKSDERFTEQACPRSGMIGECALATGEQSSVWYEGGTLNRAEAEGLCKQQGGVWMGQ